MKSIPIIKYLFTVVGLGMLLGSIYLYKNTQEFLADAITAKGTVIELVRSRSNDSTTYRPVVEFNSKDGTLIEFTSSTGSNPASYSRGETVEILYQEQAPEDARINSFFSLWGGATIVGGLGVVFFLIGFSMILFGNLKTKKIKALKANGIKINTNFQSVEINTSLKVNGRSPYQIYTQWDNPAKSEVHLFKSENIWFDPSDHIKDKNIGVWIEKNNPKKYHVDISFLPKLSS